MKLPSSLLVLLATTWAACSTGPAPLPTGAPDQAACEAVARRVLGACGATHGANDAEFGPLTRGSFRFAMLDPQHPAWCLPANLHTHTPGNDPRDRWLFYFVDGHLVAIGSQQPHRNRTTTSAQWIVVAVDDAGHPRNGHTLSGPADLAAPVR